MILAGFGISLHECELAFKPSHHLGRRQIRLAGIWFETVRQDTRPLAAERPSSRAAAAL